MTISNATINSLTVLPSTATTAARVAGRLPRRDRTLPPWESNGLRRGLTVLEVLISIFILVVGLLGVAALLPVGNVEVVRAAIAHRGAEVGQRAYRELRIRGWMQPHMWLSSSGTPLADEHGELSPQYRQRPLALDPFTVAVANIGTFPGTQHMQLITLKQAMNVSEPMGVEQAEEVFVSDDILLFDRTGRSDRPPKQFPEEGEHAKRRYEGTYSWMATLVPSPGDPSLYTASVVVFYSDRPSVINSTARVPGILQNVQTRGGGEYRVSGDESAMRALRPRRWVMLTDDGAASPEQARYRWYRVLAVEGSAEDGRTERSVTLAGPDWPEGTTGLSGVVYRGVVAVYEKTVRLEDATLWWPRGRPSGGGG